MNHSGKELRTDSAQTSDEMYRAAREVLERGWVPVPISPDTKAPSMKWKDRETWIDDRAVVRRVWGPGGTHEGHGVGVLTEPSGLNVLDLDIKNDGERELADLDHKIENTLRRRTPSGGTHGIYRAQDGSISTTAGQIGPGIDTRGRGGMVVWAMPDKSYETIEDLDPADTPPWLYEAAGDPTETRNGFAPKKFATVAAGWTYVEPALRKLRDSTVGERNSLVRDAALCVGHFPDQFWTLAEAREMVLDAAIDCGADSEPDTEQTLTNALRDARAQGTHELIGDDPPGKSEGDWRLISGAEFILSTPETTPAVWGDGDQVLWAEGEPLIITGPTGVGKTTIGAQLVLGRIGQLGGLLGFSVVEGHKVLYLACDRPKQIARALRRAFKDVDPAVLDERLIFQSGPPPRDLALHPEMLLELAQKVGADTVVIDSIKDVAMKLSDEETGQGLNRAFQLCVAAGIDVMAYHHQRKKGSSSADSKPRSIDDVFGSTWITAGAGSVVLIWGAAGDTRVEMVHLKQPADRIGPLDLIHDHAAGSTSIAPASMDLAVHLAAEGEDGMTVAAAAALLIGGGTADRAERETARRALDALVKKGIATKVEGAKGASVVYVHADAS